MIANPKDIIVAIHKILPTIPNQAKCIKALDNNEINNLSPLVVSNPRTPFLGVPPGTFFSHKIIKNKHMAIKTKKAAVCHVQAIQVMNSKSKKPFSRDSETDSQPSNNTLFEGTIIILYLKQILSLYNFLQSK